VTNHEDRRGAGELLAAIAGNVAVVPVALGSVALGGAVLFGRALADVASHAVSAGSRKRRRRSRSHDADRRLE
jgi:hypothetical protein